MGTKKQPKAKKKTLSLSNGVNATIHYDEHGDSLARKMALILAKRISG